MPRTLPSARPVPGRKISRVESGRAMTSGEEAPFGQIAGRLDTKYATHAPWLRNSGEVLVAQPPFRH
jgi:hypothetical protein